MASKGKEKVWKKIKILKQKVNNDQILYPILIIWYIYQQKTNYNLHNRGVLRNFLLKQ